MPVERSHSSRELSNRVEIDFHKRRGRFRSAVWIVALVLAVATMLWLGWQMTAGERRLFAGGEVATPHKMFENDCSKCHAGAEWRPVKRLATLNDSVSSVLNEKCLACHEGPEHHAGQVPAHAEISCAVCHREHEGDVGLAWVDDAHCIDCHADLKVRRDDGEIQSSEAYVNRITSFDGPPEAGGHPEFALARLVKLDTQELPDERRASLERIVYDAHPLVKWFQREGEREERWQDNARIRFNHKVHVHAKYEDGRLVEGLFDADRNLVDLSNQCTTCHEFDAARRYMQPISYERHCAECHPLFFDVDRQRDGQPATVPHESPELVRGFLTEFYTLQALKNPAGGAPAERLEPPRSLPGKPDRPLLTSEAAANIDRQVQAAEATVLDHTHKLFAQEGTRGGCRYCHEVEEAGAGGSFAWQVVPPNIPDRWLVHSKFRHDSHRMLACAECHRSLDGKTSVVDSASTGDVLIPSIERCQKCHTREIHADVEDREWARFGGARTSCVECHNYHDHREEDFNGPLNVQLRRRTAGKDASSRLEITK
ncbi:MAG: cytochrome c3 family protein [Planctomycetes bacterium]|nr:cytochrome c3 family protein [Planctomycetota bacterium]